jgi:hypothetical protein
MMMRVLSFNDAGESALPRISRKDGGDMLEKRNEVW